MFYTYVIQSATIDKIYIGQTKDVENRLYKHNTNQNKWTKNKGPWIMLGFVSFSTRTEAIKLENKLKKWRNPQRVKEWIGENASV